ncbi:MAG: MBG domain-containing protein, partial [Tannerella sp.]|nr:MBG domain-containing protein [Tannerella sp.]
YNLTNGSPYTLTGDIDRITPTPAALDFTLSDVAYDGLAHPVTVTPASGVAGLGAITVYYNGSTTPPVAADTYAVTVDIAGDGMNYLAAPGLTLGSYKITGIPPTSADLDFHLSDVTYDGSAHPVTVTFKAGSAGFGAITAVKYNGSATPPTAAGAYTLTVDIAAGTGHAAIDNLTLGTFIIAKAKPTLAALDFTLGDIACTGVPYPVPIIPAKDIEGLGAITVYYNGSATVPVDPGEYTVTIDIAEGDNYAAITGLPLGAFTIQEPPIPIPTHFRVLLPSVAGLTTDPPAGTYNVSRGANFTFTLTPDVPSEDGTPPQVQTNRPTPDRPNASGIRITPNADGSYTVVIIGIRQDIEITLAVADSKSDPTDSESVAAAGLEVYSAPGAIVVANRRPDVATVRVYNLAGTLVRLTTVPPGTAHLAVSAGIYIVTDGVTFRRKTVVLR